MDDEDRLFYLESDAKRGDLIELYAEMDCLIAISACPGGNCNGAENLPLGVTVFSTDRTATG